MTAIGSVVRDRRGSLWQKVDEDYWALLRETSNKVGEETIMGFAEGKVIYEPSPLKGLQDGSVIASKKYPAYVAVKTNGAWELAGEGTARDDDGISRWFSNSYEIIREIR